MGRLYILKNRIRWSLIGVRELFVLFSLTLTFFANGQDPQFSQFYAAPLYVNPAFTGNTPQGRITANYRHQWPKISGAFVTQTVAYDHYIADMNSGLGLSMVRDQSGTGNLGFTSFGASYAYRLAISRKLFLGSGFGAAYVQRSANLSDFKFSDQIVTGGTTSADGVQNDKITYADLNSGLVLYSSRFWVGMAGQHLNEPNESISGDNSPLPMKFSVHGGVLIPIQKAAKSQTIKSLTLAANYKTQGKFNQLDLGGYYNHQSVVMGLWYRGIPLLKGAPGYASNDAIIFLLGYQTETFRVGYSYDFTVSRLVTHTGGSHELAIGFEFASKKRRRRVKHALIPCAKF